MANKHTYRFCFGPWNISEGQDPYGPTTRPAQSFDWKLAQLKKHGFEAMMFHDDDAVPEIDSKSESQIRKEAKELKKRLDGLGIAAEMVAPRLWFAPQTIDGAYTSNDPKCRRYAIERSLRSIDLANILGTDILVLWLAREGSYIRESKDAGRCLDYLVEALDQMLGHDKRIRLAIEPKPNEPMDHAYLPTIGHALAVASLTRDSKRVGCLIESAHAILAGLDPADEIDFAMKFGKLWSLHLNDQNGLKYDQDRPFGNVSLRSAFDQVRVLERTGYGTNGEYVCFDVHPFRTTKPEHWMDHLLNSRRTFLRLVEKVRSFDEKAAQKLAADRDYQALDQMVIEHLLGKLTVSMRVLATIALTALLVTTSHCAEDGPNGIIKEFETKESIKQWATNAHGGAQFLEFTHRTNQFIAVSLRHTWGAPSSEVFLFKFRYGRWAALLHLGDPEFDAAVAVKRNRFQVWKRYYSSKGKARERRKLYVEYDLDALERDP